MRTIKVTHPIAIKRILQNMPPEALLYIKLHIKKYDKLPVYTDFIRTMSNYEAPFLFWNVHPFDERVSSHVLEIIRKNKNVVRALSVANRTIILMNNTDRIIPFEHRIIPFEAISYIEWDTIREHCNNPTRMCIPLKDSTEFKIKGYCYWVNKKF